MTAGTGNADTADSTGGVGGGVGRTALMVAAARAIESHRAGSPVRDPWAERFVRAAPGADGWPLRPEQVPDGDANPLWGRLGGYFGLRTRVFDQWVRGAVRSATTQLVLLGAGLDARAFRLDWPPGRVVYEVDTADVLAFKEGVLAGAAPAVTRRPVAADLRGDWAAPLLAAGFDPDRPSAWLAEGVLLYLSAGAERELIATVDRLAAPGSAFTYETKVGVESAAVRANPVYTGTLAQIGVDLLALFGADERPDSASDLTSRGWTAAARLPSDFARVHGAGPLPEPDDALGANRWVYAWKPGA